MLKARRHSTILKLIKSKPIETQEELALELRRAGIHVTQATVSRDIKELRLVKVSVGDGTYRYALPSEPPAADLLKRARRAFREYVVEIDYSGNLIVIKTLPGSAHAVAASLDDMDWSEVIATVAGDDTILVIVRQQFEDSRPIDPNVTRILDRLRRLRIPSTRDLDDRDLDEQASGDNEPGA